MFFWNLFSCSCSESAPEPLSWSFLLPWLCSGSWLHSGADPRGPLANAWLEVEISTLKQVLKDLVSCVCLFHR